MAIVRFQELCFILKGCGGEEYVFGAVAMSTETMRGGRL